MKFAVNYSPLAARLLEENIGFDCDFFKCPDWPHLVKEAQEVRPVYVHFDLQLGNGPASEEKLALVEDLLQSTNTPFVNTHITPRPLGPEDQPSDEEILARVIRDLQQLTSRFGAEKIIVESIYDAKPYFGKFCANADFISRIINEAGTGFLLDIAHTRIAAMQNNESFPSYASRLPIHRLKEAHITGVGTRNGVPVDHREMLEADWDALHYALETITSGVWPKPHVVACEYGGVGGWLEEVMEEGVMREQFPRLWTEVSRASEKALASTIQHQIL